MVGSNHTQLPNDVWLNVIDYASNHALGRLSLMDRLQYGFIRNSGILRERRKSRIIHIVEDLKDRLDDRKTNTTVLRKVIPDIRILMQKIVMVLPEVHQKIIVRRWAIIMKQLSKKYGNHIIVRIERRWRASQLEDLRKNIIHLLNYELADILRKM